MRAGEAEDRVWREGEVVDWVFLLGDLNAGLGCAVGFLGGISFNGDSGMYGLRIDRGAGAIWETVSVWFPCSRKISQFYSLCAYSQHLLAGHRDRQDPGSCS